jgi:hypothetical protein
MKALERVKMTGVALGIGSGETAGGTGPSQPVNFSWTSTDGGISGSMTASTLGKTYQGRFFQITQQTTAQVLDPLWAHWRPGWRDWPYWAPGAVGGYPTTVFLTRYSGKVVATLDSGPDHMRCRFHLVDPPRGMSGGGEGECQNTAGQTIRASFPSR